jgi:ubiquinol-cytochrome c reductase cytochrome b subunit
MIAGVVILHIWALHVPGNNNPTGVEVKDVEKDTVPFHPYYTVKDGFAIVLFLIIFAAFVFYAPNVLGHADNYIEANPLVTPAHIVPEWYLLPFYAILRAITFDIGPISAKLLGVIFMFGSIAVLFALPWLDTSKVKSMRYRPVAKQFFFGFVAAALLLGWCGASNPDDPIIPLGDDKLQVAYTTEAGIDGVAVFAGYEDAAAFRSEKLAEGATASISIKKAPAFRFIHLAQILTAYYFAYFLIILPYLGLRETPKDEPDAIHKSVLGSAAAVPAE